MLLSLPDEEYEWINYTKCRDAFSSLTNNAARNWWYDQKKHYIFGVDLNNSLELYGCDNY